MATTTPNYGWTVPTSTDLVKDGATAIETLGDSIDASMFTALGTKKSGLVLLNTTSFSAVSTQPINDVFSSTYDHYRIVCDFIGSTAVAQYMRLRVSGADNTSTNYNRQYLLASNTLVSGGRSTINAWAMTNATSTTRGAWVMDVFNPFLTQVTGAFSQQLALYNGASNFINLEGHAFNTATSFTGFSIYPDTGTITGTVSVYGYNK